MDEDVNFEVSNKHNIRKNNKNFFKFVLTFLLIFFVVFILMILYLLKFNNVGISIGNNNNNFGYANKQGKWIYYMTLSDDASKIAIKKIEKNGKGIQTIVEKDWEIYSLNVYKNYLYFIAYEEIVDEDTFQNNKIYKMSLDGKELRVINDNNFSDDCRTIYVVDNRIYYIGENYNIYSMDLEGGDRTLVSNKATGYIGISDKYIFYNDFPENPQSETDYITYIMNLDGTNSRPVNGERLYNLNVIKNDIYYVNGENSEIHKIGIDDKNDTVICKSPAYNMNVSGDYIYYINYKNENADSDDEPVCIHRIKTDGTEHQIVCEMKNYTSFIDIVGDWIYYTDHDDYGYYINLIKIDGKETVQLYEYKYNDIPVQENEDNTNSEDEDITKE